MPKLCSIFQTVLIQFFVGSQEGRLGRLVSVNNPNVIRLFTYIWTYIHYILSKTENFTWSSKGDISLFRKHYVISMMICDS